MHEMQMQSPESLSLPADTLSRPRLQHNLFKNRHARTEETQTKFITPIWTALALEFCSFSFRHFFYIVLLVICTQIERRDDCEAASQRRWRGDFRSDVSLWRCRIDVAWQGSRPANCDPHLPTARQTGVGKDMFHDITFESCLCQSGNSPPGI